jgi:hypothetical protein
MLDKNFDNKRIILVGPSPHLMGKKLGNFIDSFDVVIRVNELGVIEEMTQDYGSRTDVAFLTLTDNSLPIYMKMKDEVIQNHLKLVVCPGDEYNYDPTSNSPETKNVKEYFNYLDLDVDFYHIKVPTFDERCKIFGCFPSTGSLTIFELLNHNYKELYICGFSFYTTKFRYSPKGMEYFRIHLGTKSKQNYRWSGHNTRQEIKVLKEITRNHSRVDGDKFFRRIILSKTNLYYELRRFIIYKLNFDNYKNIIKKLFKQMRTEP